MWPELPGLRAGAGRNLLPAAASVCGAGRRRGCGCDGQPGHKGKTRVRLYVGLPRPAAESKAGCRVRRRVPVAEAAAGSRPLSEGRL